MQVMPKAHPFERTLGPGPYRFAGFFDLGACLAALNAGNVEGYNNGLASLNALGLKSGGGTCSHCGMAIINIFIVKTGNGDLYGVGSDCIAKVNKAEEGTQATRELAAKVRQELNKAKNVRLAARLEAAIKAWDPQTESPVDLEMKKLSAEVYSRAVWCASKGCYAGDAYRVKNMARLVEEAVRKVKQTN